MISPLVNFQGNKYTWGQGYIKFISETVIDTSWGKGVYKWLNEYTLEASLNGFSSIIVFNSSYTEYSAIRKGDLLPEKGTILGKNASTVVLELQQHINTAFEKAERGESKITVEIWNMEGMTGKKTRHFYNNLLNKDDARYLEIGTWKGSSVCSAMCGNKAKVVCIDNWSEFGGPKDEFLTNFNTYKGENDASFIEQDCYKVDVSKLPKFNIYMYDGNHTKDSHYKALLHYYNCLDNIFVFIVDDWNWKEVRDGTYDSFKQLKLSVLYEREIKTRDADDSYLPLLSEIERQWHNGIYVAILQKQN